MEKFFLWKGVTLTGKEETGVISAKSRKSALQELHDDGLYRISTTLLPPARQQRRLALPELIAIIREWNNLLRAGFNMKETFEFLARSSNTLNQQFIFCFLRQKVSKGDSLARASSELQPMLPELFVSVVGMSEKTGNLMENLVALEEYYTDLDRRKKQLKKLLRYPLTVLIFSLIMFLGLLVFVIPMFQGMYLMFEGDLPLLTKVMIHISEHVREYGLVYVVVSLIILLDIYYPILRRGVIVRRIKGLFSWRAASSEDPIMFAHAMKIMLQGGIKSKAALLIAEVSVSEENRKYIHRLLQFLLEGKSFSQGFKSISWFPSLFYDYISAAEITGNLRAGFDQVYQNLKQKREDQFTAWSSLLEPLIMVLLGGMVLLIMVAVYLPLFELGGKF